MAFALFSGIPAFNTSPVSDTHFRRYKDFSDQLTAMGFPQTSDTGQVNWATVTQPGPGVYTVYEVRRFDDAEQATAPIFFKIFYGYEVAGGMSRIRIQFGTGSNGTGTLLNPFTTLINVCLALSTTERTWLISSDGSGFALLPGTGSSIIARLFLGIERGRNADGSVNPRYLMVYYATSTSTSSINVNDPSVVVFDLEDLVSFSSDIRS